MLLLLQCFKSLKNDCPRLGNDLLSKHKSMISLISFRQCSPSAKYWVRSLWSCREHKYEIKAFTEDSRKIILFGVWEIWGTKKLSWKILHHDPVYTCIYMYVQCVYTCINWYVFTGLWYKVGVYMKQNNISIRVLSALQYLIVYSNVFHKTI